MSDIPTEISPERGREEMRALVAMLTAGAEMLQGKLTPEQYGELVAPIITDVWRDEPLEAIPCLTAICLRLCTWVAQAYDLDGVETVLRALAADIEGPGVDPSRPA